MAYTLCTISVLYEEKSGEIDPLEPKHFGLSKLRGLKKPQLNGTIWGKSHTGTYVPKVHND